LVVLYMVYLYVIARRSPEQAGGQPESIASSISIAEIMHALVPPIVLIVLVLGTILGGVATPTEAASVGAVGAILLGAARLGSRMKKTALACGMALFLLFVLAQLIDLRVFREQMSGLEMTGILIAFLLVALLVLGLAFSTKALDGAQILRPVLQTTVQITTMIFVILIGATIFSLVFRGLGGDESIGKLLEALPGGTFGALLGVMAIMFILGFFLDFLEITFVVVPLVAPALLQMTMADGTMVNPIWLGILMAIILQTSFLTPPFGVALFYLRGVAPGAVKTIDIYRGVVPFVCIQLLVLAILWNFPALATWLPGLIYGVN